MREETHNLRKHVERVGRLVANVRVTTSISQVDASLQLPDPTEP